MTDFYNPDVPEDLRDMVQTIKDLAPTAPIVMTCNCGYEQPITNSVCPACGGDVS